MNQVMNYFQISDVQMFTQDAFIYYSQSPERVDVVVLNYMLSDMKKFNATQYQGFLANLMTFLRQKQPRYLLINDIYLCISLSASADLLKALKQSGLTYRGWAAQYHYYNPSIGKLGKPIQKQAFSMTDAAIVNRYSPFSDTNGIQTIIKFL